MCIRDSGSTIKAYASAHLGTCEAAGKQAEPFGGDALTVNGYLGTDGIAPLLEAVSYTRRDFYKRQAFDRQKGLLAVRGEEGFPGCLGSTGRLLENITRIW